MISRINSIPYNYKKVLLPEKLIYNMQTSNEYHLIDSKTGKILGRMRANLKKDYDNVYNKGTKTRVFYIEYLNIKRGYRREGNGTELIKFAKNKSLELESEGRVSLYAYNPEYPPHVFYKKLGFESKSSKKNKKMDECIIDKKSYMSMSGLSMYLPIGDIKKANDIKNSKLLDKFMTYFKNIFT